MLLFVSGATISLRKYSRCGELIVPGAKNRPDTLRLAPGMWACDSGGYSGFDVDDFMGMLEAFHPYRGCRFVAAPDIVGDAPATLARWPFWAKVIRGVGFPPALVAQDGLTVGDVPWSEIAALFIGGHTEWKLGPAAAQLVSYAKARGLWVHMGRVNSTERIGYAASIGVDSFDGSRHSWYPDTHIPTTLAAVDATVAQRRLL